MIAINLFVCLLVVSIPTKGIDIRKETTVCCFENQIIPECYNACSENTCENILNPPKHSCTEECQPVRCQCEKGLFRNKCNECVTKDQCAIEKLCTPPRSISCPGQFEEVNGCFDPEKARVCPNEHCSSMKHCSSPKSPFISHEMVKQYGLCSLSMCDCSWGFLRNRCGKCVPEKECAEPCEICTDDPCPDPNEERRKSFADCEARTCENLLNPKECDCDKEKCHRNKCDCKPGYRRNKCNKCIPDKQCSNEAPCLCTNPCKSILNQEIGCYNDCNIRTCENFPTLKYKRCSDECFHFDCQCSKMKDLWLKDGKCVPSTECPQN